MKWKPVLCVAVLALGAGCKSSQQNPYASFGEYGFSYDLVQAPVPGLTVAENDRINRTPTASPVQLLAQPAPQVMQPMPTSADSQPAGTAAAATATPTPAPPPAPATSQ